MDGQVGIFQLAVVVPTKEHTAVSKHRVLAVPTKEHASTKERR